MIPVPDWGISAVCIIVPKNTYFRFNFIMKNKIWILPCIVMMVLVLQAASCKNTQKAPRKYDRMEKQMIKEEGKALEAAKKQHLKIQSKATRQMMKDAKRRSRQLNKPKKR